IREILGAFFSFWRCGYFSPADGGMRLTGVRSDDNAPVLHELVERHQGPGPGIPGEGVTTVPLNLSVIPPVGFCVAVQELFYRSLQFSEFFSRFRSDVDVTER